ncbi:hypothetical protein ACFL67_01595, partial [candidate division KSB1 bacterium]
MRVTKKILYAFIIAALSCSAACICDHDSPYQPEPESEYPVARLGEDLTFHVGQYVVLDGSASTAGRDKKINYWEWGEFPDNPQERALFSGPISDTNTIGFEKQGIFRYTLSVKNDSGAVSL